MRNSVVSLNLETLLFLVQLVTLAVVNNFVDLYKMKSNMNNLFFVGHILSLSYNVIKKESLFQ